MKKRTHFRKQNILFCFIIGICFFVPSSIVAQVMNKGKLYVHDDGEAYIASGNYSFDDAGTTITSRSALNYGVLSFSAAATYSFASSEHFADGYIRSYGGGTFTYPVGQSGQPGQPGKYAPVRISPSSVISGRADVAYFSSNPSAIGSAVNASVATISTAEYWRVKSCNTSAGQGCAAYFAAVSLTWNSTSGIATLTSNDISNLTISGWNGTSWQRLESAVDATSILGGSSTTTSGSITTTVAIDLAQFEYFTFGNIGNSCAPLVASSETTKTWNGSSWSPSAPTLADPVIINAAFSGNLSCNSIVLNANVTIGNGQLLEIVYGATGTGTVILSTQANLVQRNSTAAAPTIQLTKVTNSMRMFDYVLLSSPINSGATFYSNLNSGSNVAVEGNFNTYPSVGNSKSAFSSDFKTLNDLGQQILINTATIGIGYGLRARVANQLPFTTNRFGNYWSEDKKNIHIKTEGVANNGNVSVNILANVPSLVGNPYPSAISADKILALLPDDQKTIYFWTYATAMPANFTYNNNDYATWTLAGGVRAGSGGVVPTGKIASMQSFYIKGGASARTLTFTNCMRQTTGNTNFFRLKPTDRFWLNLTGSSGSFSQILVSYTSSATLGEDAGYDGMRYGTGSTSTLSSLINNSKYAIQARPPFDATDTVPLAVDKLQNDDFTISLDNKEGVFNNIGTTIYLHDKILGIYHDLSVSSYSFVQADAEDRNRFEIVYQNQTLNTNPFAHNQAVAIFTNNRLEVRANSKMNFIEIFDLTGRKIWESKIDSTTTFTIPIYFSQNLYIAKIKLENGKTASIKLVNQKQ